MADFNQLFEQLSKNPMFLTGMYGLAATPGSRGIQPIAQGFGQAYQHLARLEELNQKKEASEQYKQQVAAQTERVRLMKRQQEQQEEFAKEIAGRIDPNLGPTQNLTPQQIIYMGLSRGVVDPLDAAKALGGGGTAQRPFQVPPQGALVSPTGEELYRNPAMRGSGVIRDPGTGLPMVPGEGGAYQPLPGFTPKPVRQAGVGSQADPAGRLSPGWRWIDPSDKSKGAERIPGTQPLAERKAATSGAELNQAIKLIDDMKRLIVLGEGKVTGVTGIKKYPTMAVETAKGLVDPTTPAPAIRFNQRKQLLLGSIRKMFDSGNLSNADKARMDAAIGGDIFSTPMESVEALNTLRDAVEGIIKEKQVISKQKGNKPATPQTEDEYNALPKGSLFIDPDDGKVYRK